MLVYYTRKGEKIKVVTTFITSEAEKIMSRKVRAGKMGANKMKVEYDDESNILYIKLRDGKIVDTRPLAEDVYVDVDESGDILGIEIWNASRNIIEELAKVIADKVRAIQSA